MYERGDYYAEVPPRFLDELDAHAKTGRPVCSFAEAVLENDLYKAVGHADSEAMAALKKIVAYVSCQLPPGCRGSAERVRNWRKEKRGD